MKLSKWMDQTSDFATDRFDDAAEALRDGIKTAERTLRSFEKKAEDNDWGTIVMVVAVLAAIAGALAVAFYYLRRREDELDEFEEMLYADEGSYGALPANEAYLPDMDTGDEPQYIFTEENEELKKETEKDEENK